jgi:small-conductance mechanosensitive channel
MPSSGSMRISTVSKLAAAGLVLMVVAVGIWWGPNRLPTTWALLSEGTRQVLSRTLFRVGGEPVRVFVIIKVCLFLVFLNLVDRFARRFVGFLVRNNTRMSSQRKYVLLKAVSLSIYTVGILVGIQVERINLTALAIVGGTLGLGVGFGLQTLVSNFVAGLILLFEQPIRLGDRIEFGEKSGEVVRVGGRSSSLRTYDNAILIIPNSDFVTKQILNWTASDPRIQRTIPVSVAYGTDPEEVIHNLLELAANHADVMQHPAPAVYLLELTPNAMNFSLRVWTLVPPENFALLRSDLYLAILRRFKEKQIEIPFPQLDLHLKPAGGAVSISNL